jgi:hypothetical protein
MGVELLLELIEATGEVLVRGKQLAQAHESAHNIDGYFSSSRTVQDRGGHDGAVLGENKRQVLAVLAAPGL